MRRLVLILAALPLYAAFGVLVPATTYYVNGATGSDSNNGTSTATPFLTVGKGVSSLSGAQSLAVWGGSAATGQLQYREQATLTATGQALVGYGAYQPDLTCKALITVGQWSNYSGSIYQATVTTAATITGFLRVWENGTAFTMPASLVTLTAPGYFIASNGSLSGTSFTVYVYATGGGNPASNGNTYEYNARNYGVFSQYAATVSNIQTEGNFSNNGSFEVGGNSLATDITANDGIKHNSLMHGGSIYRNLSSTNSYYNGSPKIASVLNDDSPSGQPGTWINFTYVENVEGGGVCLYGHVNTSGNFGLVTITNPNCGTTGAYTSGINGFVSTGMTITGGNVSGGIVMGSTLSNLLSGTTVGGTISMPYSVPVEIASVTASCNCTNGIVSIGASIAPSLNVHDSTFSNSRAFDGAIYVSTGTTLTAFTSQRNTFAAPVQTNHYEGPGATNLPVGSTLSNNTYHYPAALSTWILFRGTTYDISSTTPWNNWLTIEPTATRVTP